MVIIKNNKCVICRKEKEKTYESFCDECSEDNEKLKKYYDSLEKRRNYVQGNLITSFDELLKQEFIYVNHKIYHMGWFRSWSIHLVQSYINRRLIHRAIKKDSLKTPL